MTTKELKKFLAGLGIVSLIAGAGVVTTACNSSA
ncbi:MAG: selenobiotic family radical SAM modification target peptide [Desulfobulbaceae bacterium]|nr:selenobiotic family radical SAM modification target peptide [Desulfobulbaceae bacterium]